MNIIDMRLRPPYKSMLEMPVFDVEATGAFANMFDHSYMPESATKPSMDLLLQEMDEYHVSQGVITLGKSKTNQRNEDISELIARYPNRFIGFVGLDAADINNALEDIDRYIVNGPYLGANLEPTNQGKLMSDESLFPIYEKLEKIGAPMTILQAAAVISINAVSAKHIEVLAKTFPKLKICLAHGIWPGFRDVAGILFSYPNIYVSPDGYLMGLPGYQDYIQAANTVAPHQILFGSCYPIHAYSKIVPYYQQAGFHPDVLENVMYGNARRFLNLDPVDPAPWRSMPRQCPVLDLNKTLNH